MANENKFLAFLNRHSKKILIGAIVLAGLALAAAGGLWWSYKNVDPNVLATVNGENITKSDLNRAIYAENFVGSIDNPASVDDAKKDQLLGELVDKKLIEQECAKDSIKVTEADIDKEITSRNIKYSSFTADQKSVTRDSAKASLLRTELLSQEGSWKEGKYLLFRFDKYYDTVPGLLPQTGDQAAIAAQKAYAKKLSDEIYQKLVAKTITFDEADKLLSADPEIGSAALEAVRGSLGGEFDKAAYENQSAHLSDSSYNLRSEISKLDKGEYSQPFVFKNKLNNKYSEQAYAIAYVTNSGGGSISTSLEEWLVTQKQAKGVWYKHFVKTAEAPLGTTAAYAALPTTGLYECFPTAGHETAIRIRTTYVTVAGEVKVYPGVTMHMSGPSGGNYLWKVGMVDVNGVPTCNNTGSKENDIPNHAVRNDGSITHYYSGQGLYDGTYVGHFWDCTISDFGKAWIDSQPTIAGTSGGSWVYAGSSGNGQMTYTNGTAYPLWAQIIDNNNIPFHLSANGKWANGQVVDIAVQYYPTYNVATSKLNVVINPPIAATATMAPATLPVGVYNVGATVTPGYTNVQSPYVFQNWTPSVAGVDCSKPFAITGDTTCTANFATGPAVKPALSCTVTPESGLSPLVVRVNAVPTNLTAGTTYDYKMGDKVNGVDTILTGKPSEIYYTYSVPTTTSTYIVQIKTSDNQISSWVPCGGPGVTVTSPTDSSGGEVRP